MERRIVGALAFVAKISEASVLSEFPFHWICFPCLPYFIVPFCSVTTIAAVPPPHATTGVFFLISFIYADNIFPGMVFVNAVHERRAPEAYKTPTISSLK